MPPNDEARSLPERAHSSLASDNSIVTPSISGSVFIDLSSSTPERDRYEVGYLYQAPAGVKVILNVGNRVDIGATVLAMLREHGNRLRYEVRGGAEAVPRWMNALRTGEAA